jgi:uncharacterized protein with HEPN domain
MSKREDIILLEDINECIEKIQRYSNGLTISIFLQDEKSQDAIARNFEIMGEAASRLSEEFRAKHININWRLLKDFRNKLIHVYEIIDYSIVWNAIQVELPSIQSGILLLLQTLK